MNNFIEFCNEYVSVFTLIQTFFAVLSFIAAIIAVILAVKAIRETRELATKKALDICGSIRKTDGSYIFHAVIFNTGYTAVNIQFIQILKDDSDGTDDIDPLALGIKGGFGKKSYIRPQEFFQTDISISDYEEDIKYLIVKVEDVERRVFSKKVECAMG